MTLPYFIILISIVFGASVIFYRKLGVFRFKQVLLKRGWSEVPICPVGEPWLGKNYGSIRCYDAEIRPRIPCYILVARHLRSVVGTPGRRHSVDPYLGIYIPPQVRIKEALLAKFFARVAKPSMRDNLEQVRIPTEGGLVLVWRSRPLVQILDARLHEVTMALVD